MVDGNEIDLRLRLRFPRRLRSAASLRGYLEYESLARDAGVGRSTITMLLSGKRQPGVATLVRLAAALDVSVEWLCGLDVRPDGSVKEPRGDGRPFVPGRVSGSHESPRETEDESDGNCRELR